MKKIKLKFYWTDQDFIDDVITCEIIEVMEKYFTPSIEDIRVGYEAEANIKFFGDKKDNWQPFVFQGVGQEVIAYQKKGVYRVPYLTKEQIEAEGWRLRGWAGNPGPRGYCGPEPPELTEKEKMMDKWFIPVGYGDYDKTTEKGVYGLHHHSLRNIIEIIREDEKTLFLGECKDINTFRYICKLLKI